MKKNSENKSNKSRSQGYLVWERLKRNKGAMVGLVFLCFLLLVMIFADVLYDYEDKALKQNVAERLQAPSWSHPFGTDESGRDILARVIHGARRSVLIAAVAVICATAVGGALGAIAGYFGGIPGELIMRFMDVLLAIPSTLFGLIIIASLGSSIPNLILAVTVPTIP